MYEVIRRGIAGLLDRFERAMFTIMGPAQVGDVNEPVRPLPRRPVDLCPGCGQPRDEHVVVRSPRLTYTQCPGRPAGPAARPSASTGN